MMTVMVVILALLAGAMHFFGSHMGSAAPYAVAVRNVSCGVGLWCLAWLAFTHHFGGGGLLIAGIVLGLLLVLLGIYEVPEVERMIERSKSDGNKPTTPGTPSV